MLREWGHMNKTVLRKILKTAKAPQEYLDAVDSHLCNDCELTAPKAQTTKVGNHPNSWAGLSATVKSGKP